MSIARVLARPPRSWFTTAKLGLGSATRPYDPGFRCRWLKSYQKPNTRSVTTVARGAVSLEYFADVTLTPYELVDGFAP